MTNDIVVLDLLRKKINEETYVEKYVYSLENEKLLEPTKTKRDSSYEDKYSLSPGKYIIIEVNINNMVHNCGCKSLVVFSRDDFLYNKRKQFPGANINAFKAVYQYGGWEIAEWKGNVPNWLELPCECLYYLRDLEKDRGEIINEYKINEYKQTQEVEDVLSQLLPKENDVPKIAAQYLVQKNKNKGVK